MVPSIPWLFPQHHVASLGTIYRGSSAPCSFSHLPVAFLKTKILPLSEPPWYPSNCPVLSAFVPSMHCRFFLSNDGSLHACRYSQCPSDSPSWCHLVPHLVDPSAPFMYVPWAPSYWLPQQYVKIITSAPCWFPLHNVGSLYRVDSLCTVLTTSATYRLRLHYIATISNMLTPSAPCWPLCTVLILSHHVGSLYTMLIPSAPCWFLLHHTYWLHQEYVDSPAPH